MSKILAVNKPVFFSIVLVAALAGFSCEKYTYNPPAVDPNYAWSLQTDIQPIFDNNCIACHGNRVTPNLSAGQSFNALTRGNYVTSPAEQSRLLDKITTDPDHARLVTEAERLRIRYWIEQGAKNN